MIHPDIMSIAREEDARAWRNRRVTHQRPWPRYAANIATLAFVVAAIFAGVWFAVQAVAEMLHL